MLRLRALFLSVLAVLMMLGSSYAVGLNRGMHGCTVAMAADLPDPVNVPAPTDLLCGKRLMPGSPEVKPRPALQVPRATEAQWRFGLADEPMPEGRGPMTALEPPRAA